jgi:hypothetical protein
MYAERKYIFLLLLAFVFCRQASAQTEITPERNPYHLVLYTGPGMSYYSAKPGVPDELNTKVTRFGPSYSVRVMWHPDHLLRFGIESGWTTFYKWKMNGPESAMLKLTAIPILAEWSMPIGKHINIFAGTGTYFVKSKLDFAGAVSSTTMSIGWMLAGSYIRPVTDRLSLAAELKWLNAAETNDAVMNLQIQLVWKFLKW